jgi:hypothetical protein
MVDEGFCLCYGFFLSRKCLTLVLLWDIIAGKNPNRHTREERIKMKKNRKWLWTLAFGAIWWYSLEYPGIMCILGLLALILWWRKHQGRVKNSRRAILVAVGILLVGVALHSGLFYLARTQKPPDATPEEWKTYWQIIERYPFPFLWGALVRWLAFVRWAVAWTIK